MNTKENTITIAERATLRRIAGTLDELKGEDIVVLDVRELLIPTSFMIISSAGNPKQLRAMLEAVESCLDVRPLRCEGTDSLQWGVVDFGSMIVHVMSTDARTFYELDELWDRSMIQLD